MKRFLLLLLAIIGLPLVWVLVRCFLEALAMDTLHGPLCSPGRISFLAGCGVMMGIYAWKGNALQVLYVFAHEMTHAVAGLCCFAKVHKVSIQATGGFVQLSKGNLIITLAPYCVPFYLLLAVVLYGLMQWWMPDLLPFAVWAFLFGVLTAFHVLYTIGALFAVSQPDTHEYGRFFSWWFILVMNLCFAVLAVVITSPTVTARGQAKRLIATTQRVYSSVYDTATMIAARWINETPSERERK